MVVILVISNKPLAQSRSNPTSNEDIYLESPPLLPILSGSFQAYLLGMLGSLSSLYKSTFKAHINQNAVIYQAPTASGAFANHLQPPYKP